MSQTGPVRTDPRRFAPPSASVSGLSIGEYLIRRLQDYGIRHVFGIPGDYVLGFYSLLEKSPLETIGCTREDCAGFAADAYARVHGMGAVCVTYCVGGLSLCNSIAGAYAEKSPVVVITGSPGLSERVNNPLLHHKVRDFRTQYDVFEKLCIAGAELNEPLVAFHEIDRVLHAAASYKRPVYIEIPRDMVRVVPDLPHQFHNPPASERPGGAGRSGARGRALDRQLPAAGDHRRRGDPPLRPARRSVGAGRGLADSDHHHDAGQEHHSAKRIRCSSACTKGRWATTR